MMGSTSLLFERLTELLDTPHVPMYEINLIIQTYLSPIKEKVFFIAQ